MSAAHITESRMSSKQWSVVPKRLSVSCHSPSVLSEGNLLTKMHLGHIVECRIDRNPLTDEVQAVNIVEDGETWSTVQCGTHAAPSSRAGNRVKDLICHIEPSLWVQPQV